MRDMLFKLIILFIVVPTAELALLIEIGRLIGLWPTIGIVVLTGIIGGSLLKQQGISTISRFKRDFRSGIFPADTLLHGVLIIIGGAFLLTPGIVTDLLGFLLLIPLTRSIVSKFVKAYLKKRFQVNFEEIQRTPDYPQEEHPENYPPLDPNKRVN